MSTPPSPTCFSSLARRQPWPGPNPKIQVPSTLQGQGAGRGARVASSGLAPPAMGTAVVSRCRPASAAGWAWPSFSFQHRNPFSCPRLPVIYAPCAVAGGEASSWLWRYRQGAPGGPRCPPQSPAGRCYSELGWASGSLRPGPPLMPSGQPAAPGRLREVCKALPPGHH